MKGYTIVNELDTIVTRYFSKDTIAITYSEIDEEEFNKMIQNMGYYERPDILSIYDDKIVGIEHFEFDSYKNTRKGSNYKIQENFIEQKFNKMINSKTNKKNEIVNHDQIINTSNLKQYYDNFKKILISHINNIDEYIEHIVSNYGSEKTIEIWFFVEDVNPLGNYYLKKGNCSPGLLLPFSKEIIDILRNNKGIKGIIFGVYAMNEYKIVICYNDEKTLNKIEKDDYFKVDDSEFLSLNPQTTSFVLLIPKNKK